VDASQLDLPYLSSSYRCKRWQIRIIDPILSYKSSQIGSAKINQERVADFAALIVLTVLRSFTIPIESTANPERKPIIGPAGSKTIVKFLVSIIPSIIIRTTQATKTIDTKSDGLFHDIANAAA
jgi:hypothetical protein